jgi:Na+/phosphate symporter
MQNKLGSYVPPAAEWPKPSPRRISLDEFHEKLFAEWPSIQGSLLSTINELTKITRTLAAYVCNEEVSRLRECESLVQGIRHEVRVLNRSLAGHELRGDVLAALAHLLVLSRFLCNLGGIADALEQILDCYRLNAKKRVALSTACRENLGQLLAILMDVLHHLGDALKTPDSILHEYIFAQWGKYRARLRDFRLAHLAHLDARSFSFQATVSYFGMLKSLDSIGEHVEQVYMGLLALQAIPRICEETINGRD